MAESVVLDGQLISRVMGAEAEFTMVLRARTKQSLCI